MINGTKLLNVTGMTRGRRDGILKSEKNRAVVKIGPMHLKGVWIPFERALDFANKEMITDRLYPLFVHNIAALLCASTGSSRISVSGTTQVVAGDRRRTASHQDYLRTPQSIQAPLPQSMSHHSGAQPPHSIAPHPAAGRPLLDRSHTFPTPPTSASSMMNINHSGGYEWGAPLPTAQANGLTIDTGINSRSVPQTPATTPPGSSVSHMSTYQTNQPYDATRQMYSAPPQHGNFGSQQGMARYGQIEASPYIKSEMAPPARAGAEDSNGEHKPHDGYSAHPKAEHYESEHEGDYTHSAGPYNGNRTSYGYGSNSTQNSLHGDQQHMSSELTGSPHHKPSGGATPRTTSYSTYPTPQRSQLPSSNLYDVISDNRNASNGAEMYGGHAYPAPYPIGLPALGKRVRELEDADDGYNGPDDGSLKRRRTVREDSAGQPHAILATKKR